MNAASPTLPPHALKVALIHPQIAPNTGNIARLCVASGAELHLVRPLGFVLSDRQLRRSAMDYWPRLKLTVHDDLTSFLHHLREEPAWWFTSKSERSVWDGRFEWADWLIFGSETHGIGEELLRARDDRTLRIPQTPEERCLNLATAVGIGLYEALRQVTTSSERR